MNKKNQFVIKVPKFGSSVWFFEAALFIYICYQIINKTYIPILFPRLLYTLTTFIPIILLIIRGLKYNTMLRKRKFLILFISVFILFFLISMSNGFFFEMGTMFLLLISSVNVDFKDIIKTQFVALCCCVILTLGFVSVGLIPDVIYTHDKVVAHSYGFQYYTTFPNVVFCATMCWLYLCNRKKLVFKLFFVGAINFVCYYVSTSFHTFLSFLVFSLLYILFSWFKIFNIKHLIWKGFSFIYFPAAASLSIVLAVVYPKYKKQLYSLNLMFKHRIRLMSEGLHNYGVHLFGSRFRMIGTGNASQGKYNYIDNGYVYLLLAYGVIFTICIILFYSYTLFKMIEKENILMFCWIISIGVFAISNQILIQIKYNPILYLTVGLLMDDYFRKKRKYRII